MFLYGHGLHLLWVNTKGVTAGLSGPRLCLVSLENSELSSQVAAPSAFPSGSEEFLFLQSSPVFGAIVFWVLVVLTGHLNPFQCVVQGC